MRHENPISSSRRALGAVAGLSLAIAACEYAPGGGTAKQDTTVAPANVAAGQVAVDSGPLGGVPAVPAESLGLDSLAVDSIAAPADSGVIRLHPERPRRGGVLFALAEGIAPESPRCSWKGQPLPCHRHGTGVLAIVPLTADDSAGTYLLTFDRPNGGRLSRRVTVEDVELGREIVFLDRELWARVRRTGDVARDARAVRAVLSSQTPERQWSGAWRDPLAGAKTEGYGVERFYHQASDSSRSVSIDRAARTRGAFAADTSSAAATGAPGWRHSGVDIAARRGAQVVAPAAGTVMDVGDYVLTGKTLLVDHGQGVFSAYFHLDTALVQKGDAVRPGRAIARVGSTGLSTGPHLHYGVYIHGKDVDPIAWKGMPAWVRESGTVAVRDSTAK